MSFADVLADEMIQASADSFNQNYEKMNVLIDRITTKLLPEEQKLFILKITKKNSPIRTAWADLNK